MMRHRGRGRVVARFASFAARMGVAALLATALPNATALAQGGSAGGTIGKGNRSVSGGAPESTPAAPRRKGGGRTPTGGGSGSEASPRTIHLTERNVFGQ